MNSSHIQLFCPKERESNSQSEQQENEIVVGMSHSQYSNSTILQTCNVLASSENKTLSIRILLDSGSERTFILREVAEALNLEPIRKERLLLYSFRKKNLEPSDFDLVQLQLKNPYNPNDGIPIEALITQHISGASLGSRFLVNKTKMLNEVNGLEPAYSGKGKIQLLLGMDFFCEGARLDNLGLELQSLLSFLEGKPPCTKRAVLKSATHIFDQVGFISPFVVRIKCLLQKLWSKGLGWDEEFPDELHQNWLKGVTEIQENTDLLDWRHCDGKINPAVSITRGCDAEELSYSMKWFCGPPFLSLPEEKWPISKLPTSKTIEGQSERRSKTEISLHCATKKNENEREPVLKFENYSS
ncbi:integrase catalytic domain-containing protein [Nephila pilipes]|uniref:Integrase catalytic domain-containing protein n=1 Tax=Nephila pilipes TaxID=299642 RepID=A0A8X6MMV4_NEPPI|nr:integrase catalytic domain-containing protein [Nephila pilipes]